MPVHPPSLSVVIVSQDDARYAGVDAQFDEAFAVWPHERIRVKGATSMYDGYAQGFARRAATSSSLPTRHSLRRARFAARLADVMAHADFAGVAGTTLRLGPRAALVRASASARRDHAPCARATPRRG